MIENHKILFTSENANLLWQKAYLFNYRSSDQHASDRIKNIQQYIATTRQYRSYYVFRLLLL